ncbi:hypothetical protein N9Z27_03145 [Alphaproteobacteria bacterium]|nr:hypothetical protein [Alphaproteobacteria bacterium]
MKALGWKNCSLFFVVFALGAALLYTSQEVQTAVDALSGVEASIQKERDRIAVLEAEWEFLNSPQRLEKLARQYYGVEQPTTSQMIGGTVNIPFPAAIETIPVNGVSRNSGLVHPHAALPDKVRP